MTLDAAIARVNARAAEGRDKEKNRREMPAATAFVDEWRDMLAWGRLTENGRTIEWGKRVPDAKVSSIRMVTCGDLAALQAKHPRRW